MSEEKCTCLSEEQEENICPYQEEVDNTIVMCECCDYCRHECAMDI